MRTISTVFQAVLYNQHRDGVRLIANFSIVPIRLGLVALLVGAGAVGAAIAAVITDALLLAIYVRVLYRKPVA
jgi:Na+-driven multidrug efflux pump